MPGMHQGWKRATKKRGTPPPVPDGRRVGAVVDRGFVARRDRCGIPVGPRWDVDPPLTELTRGPERSGSSRATIVRLDLRPLMATPTGVLLAYSLLIRTAIPRARIVPRIAVTWTPRGSAGEAVRVQRSRFKA